MKMHTGLSKSALPCALLSVLLSSCGGDDPDGSGAAAAVDLTMATPSAWSVTTRTPAAAPRAAAVTAAAASETPDASLRRPLSPHQPMFLIHADTWNAADPQKIIDLIPADLRPYTVLLISLSINHQGATGNQCNWIQVENGLETARSWIKTAAANGVWAMIQPSSGGFSHLPDYAPNADLEATAYGEFFRDYPNFIGFNYAEQFWGFDQPCSGSPAQRWEHWANLLKLTNKYGGYLAVSFTGGFYSANINPLAMVKRNQIFRNALGAYAKNFIIEEKFTSNYGYHDIESVSLGMFLSGYAGHYGIRTDRSGWYSSDGSSYPVQAGSPHLIEHLTFTGETVFDGPEQITLDAVHTLPNATTADGYNSRRWEFYPHFRNIQLDIYRKILDGTLRILSRQEVIDRSKVVIVNDTNTGDDRNLYSSPETLFSGLYLLDGDGTYMNQHSWYKKTGRYPAIPTVWQLTDATAKSFKVQIAKTAYAARWPTMTAKLDELNALFPQEYTGTIYAGRQDNTWVTYNPSKANQTASGTIPLKYNSCAAVSVNYAPYSSGVIKEFPDRLSIYLSNFDSPNGALKTDTIDIDGATATPTYTFVDRGDHQPSKITSAATADGLTLSVAHNGPLDITVHCTGNASGRASSAPVASLQAPDAPPAYTGVQQYEAENFDFRNIRSLVANGVSGPLRNYQGMGYVDFGTGGGASIRDDVRVASAGTYQLQTRYSTAGASIANVDLYVNGSKVGTPAFAQTTSASDWATLQQPVTLNAGSNRIEFRASGTRPAALYLDNIRLSH
ncbi:carbohydrate-binding protein [Xanthomonas translucens pv. undulosa]|uniref:glycoside hydrolase family 98 domain-containing protein n=1 Tax=Xanthomonas campestris pv. translucens TaxID=343 RepID=UPI0019D4EFB1|nr:glycoside hydrolase family 98 domain-containing protein [Xanthomonas translucens]QSQ41524.1 carbohydrate-binding protein [Xanthomonas translucens pv. translucens]QSQ50604.1 carbohydrate-binding protein [Xanthomonas translucens pv. undulosa]WLA12936.1 carbohydrate-binding protein [Xanthomonas translucens]